ncbi:MAG: peptidase M50 [Parcubacteria group bacterium Gr01-1014_107]|nr:MAG: peptidase M50 [Parcubacteria group bacterium Gr01-1014_107]
MAGTDFIFVIVALIRSGVSYERCRRYAALMLGDPTAKYAGRLTLNPLKHLDPVGSVLVPLALYIFQTGIIFGWAKPVPYNPYNLRNQRWGEALVAGAGPLTNILLALVFGLAIRVALSLETVPESFIQISFLVVFINIVLAVFNLVPIAPLDGSKILFAALPLHLLEWRHKLEQFGFIILLIFIIFFWQFLLPVILFLASLFSGLSYPEIMLLLRS